MVGISADLNLQPHKTLYNPFYHVIIQTLRHVILRNHTPVLFRLAYAVA